MTNRINNLIEITCEYKINLVIIFSIVIEDYLQLILSAINTKRLQDTFRKKINRSEENNASTILGLKNSV
jgi:hypothetical protein